MNSDQPEENMVEENEEEALALHSIEALWEADLEDWQGVWTEIKEEEYSWTIGDVNVSFDEGAKALAGGTALFAFLASI